MSGRYNHDPRHFQLLSASLPSVITVLNQGRTGGLGTVSVVASSKGYRITLAGVTLAKGATPEELSRNFKAAADKAVAVSRQT